MHCLLFFSIFYLNQIHYPRKVVNGHYTSLANMIKSCIKITKITFSNAHTQALVRRKKTFRPTKQLE